MASFPPTFLAEINGAIQEGRGAAASVLGQTYAVYRNPTVHTGSPTAGVNGSVLSTNPVYTNFPAYGRKAKKIAIENTSFDLLVYEATCNGALLTIQDVLVENGIGSDGGVFTFVQSRPRRELLIARTELNCSITRPHPEGGAADQLASSGWTAPPGYAGTMKSSEAVLVLNNGFYSFSENFVTTPASVQIGLQPTRRAPDGKSLGTPTDLYRGEFLAYIPELPGAIIGEMTRINAPNQDRYEIKNLYSTGLTGLSGYVALVERIGV